jgi:hypothetical protein
MRDGEFLDPPPNRQALLETWEDGCGRLFEALKSLSEVDLVRTATIRGELPLGHAGYQPPGGALQAQWKSLSGPRN